MNNDIFSDGAINIGLTQGMIRIEFASYTFHKRDGDGNPTIEATHRLVMTPQGFMKTFASMESMVDKLVDAKVVAPNATEERRSGPARNTDATLTK
ncbi:MAG: hypothetical protein A2516_03580 [Alphaproteobacteria bacterium RIFOXYD12_FULL_60_8]|nr:MAG: hypothetical protein A2516_03580 [Alphaproteobacteria bacterium RIFOXYD12_FULL_60_8]